MPPNMLSIYYFAHILHFWNKEPKGNLLYLLNSLLLYYSLKFLQQ